MKNKFLLKDHTVWYWRGKEIVTEAQKKKMEKLFGASDKTPYNHFERFYWNDGCNTGLSDTADIVLTIQTTENLSNRLVELENRVKEKNGKLAKTKNGGFVEHNLLWRLVLDAVDECNKSVDVEDRIESYKLSWEDILRTYDFPYKSEATEYIEKAEGNLKEIAKPKKFYKLAHRFSKNAEQMSVFQHYYIKNFEQLGIKWYDVDRKGIYDNLPYLGKLHMVRDKDSYLQIYVYDYPNRDWAVNNVIDYILNNPKY